jgi:hypothetical protein
MDGRPWACQKCGLNRFCLARPKPTSPPEFDMRGKFGRVIATIIFGIVYAVATALYSPKATLLAGPAAGRQFANDADAFVSSFLQDEFPERSQRPDDADPGSDHRRGMVEPLRNWISSLVLLAVVLTGLQPPPALAYYDKADFTEAYTILPMNRHSGFPMRAPTGTIRASSNPKTISRPTRSRSNDSSSRIRSSVGRAVSSTSTFPRDD